MTERDTVTPPIRSPSEGDTTRDDRRNSRFNVLLTTPVTSATEATSCTELLSSATPQEKAVLGITYDSGADEWFSDLRDHLDAGPALLEIVEVGGLTRGAVAPATGSTVPQSPRVVAVDSPTDLTALGIHVSEFLRAAEAGRDREELEPVICFDSLTDLLRAVDLPTAFRFLHVLTGLVRSAGATAHYHLDPSAFDERTVGTVAPLFDCSGP